MITMIISTAREFKFPSYKNHTHQTSLKVQVIGWSVQSMSYQINLDLLQNNDAPNKKKKIKTNKNHFVSDKINP